MYYTYILHSQELSRYYIGYTDDIELRLKKHLRNHDGFTGKAKDWKIVYTESHETKQEARSRELKIKGWKSKRMIEKLLSSSS